MLGSNDNDGCATVFDRILLFYFLSVEEACENITIILAWPNIKKTIEKNIRTFIDSEDATYTKA